MNITNAQSYNKELGAMRQPANHKTVMDKLIFIYPMGIDQSLAMLPFNTFVKGDANTVGDALRSFFSISILKEIFASNALNLIKQASTYERYKKKENKSDQLVNNLLRGESGNTYNFSYYNTNNDYELQNVDPSVLQSKIDSKFKEIKQLMKSDIRLKKLLPFMQVITLENMLDVPVITGTWPIQMDTGALFTVLAAAISNRVKINNFQAIKRLIGKIRSMQDLNVYQIFEVLGNIEKVGTIPSTVLQQDLPGGIMTQMKQLEDTLAQTSNPAVKEEIKSQINAIKNNYAKTYIANLKDTKLNEVERAFLFLLEPGRLAMKFGLSHMMGQASYAARKISPQTEMLFSRTQEQFINFLGGADFLFSSMYSLFSPTDGIATNWPNYTDLKSNMLNYVLDNFDVFFADLKSNFSSIVEDNISSSSIAIKSLTSNCESAKEEFINTINFFNKTFNNSQLFKTFGKDSVENYTVNFDKAVNVSKTVHANLEKLFRGFFKPDTWIQINKALNSIVNHAIEIFTEEFIRTGDPTSQMQARLMALVDSSNRSPDKVAQLQQSLHNQMLTTMASGLTTILKTTFLLIFKLNLCEFVEVADVEFDIAKTDVLDPLNFCLVLPLEIINALYILLTKRQWKDAVINSGSGFNPLNSSNIKGVIKTLSIHLGIPNIIVFDRKKNEIYYYFKYLSSGTAEKLKMQSVEIYTKQHLQDSSAGIAEVFY